MSDIETNETDEGLELAKRMAEEEEGVGRRPRGYQKWVIPTIACMESFPVVHRELADFRFHIHPGDSSGFCLIDCFFELPPFKKIPLWSAFPFPERQDSHPRFFNSGCRLFLGPLYCH
jgi:hypothetical protein